MEGELKEKRQSKRAAEIQLQRGRERERETAMHTTLGKACRV